MLVVKLLQVLKSLDFTNRYELDHLNHLVLALCLFQSHLN